MKVDELSLIQCKNGRHLGKLVIVRSVLGDNFDGLNRGFLTNSPPLKSAC
jgi:hypothetical protein